MKYGKSVEKLFVYEVAPLVGAWIEIKIGCLDNVQMESLLSWERGLKYLKRVKKVNGMGRSSRGSVD